LEFNILFKVINHVKFVSFETAAAYATSASRCFASVSAFFFGKHRKSA
jgi:hypothetical protein